MVTAIPSTPNSVKTEKSSQTTVETVNIPSPQNGEVDNSKPWPYAAGFQTDEEQHVAVELEVTGNIPAYAAGTLYRTGPGNYKLTQDNGSVHETHHWFDGFTTVHRFQIQESGSTVKVLYNSRRTCDELVQNIRKTGNFKNFSFAQKRDPCQGLFKKFLTTFHSLYADGMPPYQNVGVTLSINMPGLPSVGTSVSTKTGIETLITKTDANMYQRIDPETLEPIGLARQQSLHPDLKGPLSAAHAKTCPITGDIFNYNLEVSAKSAYRVFQASASTGKTKILATIEGTPAYLHSLMLTPSTVILCVWNSHYSKRGLSLLLNRNVLDSISPLDPSLPATWYVIDRSPSARGLLATYTTPAFFCFHTINAYEEPSPSHSGETDIIADLTAYSNLEVLHRFYYKNLLPADPDTPSYSNLHPSSKPSLTRYRLPSVTLASSPGAGTNSELRPAEIVYELEPEHSPELPTINPRVSTLPHRYTYGLYDAGISGFYDGIIKHDSITQDTTTWSRHAQTAGEPIFVPAPIVEGGDEGGGKTEEDDGVLLSVVLDGKKGTSHLLCLDARTMREVGRAEVKGVVGFGFHGLHVPARKGEKEVYTGGD